MPRARTLLFKHQYFTYTFVYAKYVHTSVLTLRVYICICQVRAYFGTHTSRIYLYMRCVYIPHAHTLLVYISVLRVYIYIYVYAMYIHTLRSQAAAMLSIRDRAEPTCLYMYIRACMIRSVCVHTCIYDEVYICTCMHR